MLQRRSPSATSAFGVVDSWDSGPRIEESALIPLCERLSAHFGPAAEPAQSSDAGERAGGRTRLGGGLPGSGS